MMEARCIGLPLQRSYRRPVIGLVYCGISLFMAFTAMGCSKSDSGPVVETPPPPRSPGSSPAGRSQGGARPSGMPGGMPGGMSAPPGGMPRGGPPVMNR